jgi:hypothetical protein
MKPDGGWSLDRKICIGLEKTVKNHCNQVMQAEEDSAVHCPYCGQTSLLVLDTGIASQCFTTDCEICCRPFEVRVECAPGEILSLEVREN